LKLIVVRGLPFRDKERKSDHHQKRKRNIEGLHGVILSKALANYLVGCLRRTRHQKIKSKSLSHFSASKQLRFYVHVHHTIHHKLTTKAPHSTTHFFQNTLKTPANPRKPKPSTTRHFYVK
jgi:hypothetical protein